MIPSVLNFRLQQLEENISRVLRLLNEYEGELLDEDDPARRSKYCRRVKDLKQQKSGYEEEFAELQTQLASKYTVQTQAISHQLQEIDNKIELLLDGQASLSEVLTLHFSDKEKEVLFPFTRQLAEPELINVQAFLEVVETDQASEEEVQLMLSETRTLLEELKRRDLALPPGREAVSEMINSPTIDAKHALKVLIPIIPFILTYEAELGMETGINLKKMWQHWKTKFMKNR